jgi:hypothetical protein
MPEWWTYSPADLLMFSDDTYRRLFEIGNRRVWPLQIPVVAAGVAVMLLLRSDAQRARYAANSLLACAWLACAWTYFLKGYSTIHTFGGWFAMAFVAQAIGLSAWSALHSRVVTAHRVRDQAGVGIVGFAVVVQPLIGVLAGRPWSQVELFGLTPDPTVAATLGALLAVRGAAWMWAVPVGWSLFSGMTLFTLDAPDWFVLPLVALMTTILALARGKGEKGSGTDIDIAKDVASRVIADDRVP